MVKENCEDFFQEASYWEDDLILCSKIFQETEFIVEWFDEVSELKDLFMEQGEIFHFNECKIF